MAQQISCLTVFSFCFCIGFQTEGSWVVLMHECQLMVVPRPPHQPSSPPSPSSGTGDNHQEPLVNPSLIHFMSPCTRAVWSPYYELKDNRSKLRS